MYKDEVFNKAITVLQEGKNKDEESTLLEMINYVPFFNSYVKQIKYNPALKKLTHAFQYVDYLSGQFIIHKTQLSKTMYIILEGKASIYTPKTTNQIQEEESIINQIEILKQQLFDQQDLKSNIRDQIKESLLSYQNQLKSYEDENENNLIQQDSKSSKLYLKTHNQFLMNTFKKDKEIQKGDVFGAADWQERLKNPSSILTTTNCKLACFSNQFFLECFEMQKKYDIINYLKNFEWAQNKDFFGNLSAYFKEELYSRNQVVFKEGQAANTLYIVQKGQLEVVKNYVNDNEDNTTSQIKEYQKKFNQGTEPIELKILEEGDLFGHEDNHKKIRTYSVISRSVETVLYSVQLNLIYRMTDTDMYSSIINNGKLKKKWLKERYLQLTQCTYLSPKNTKKRECRSFSPKKSDINIKIESIFQNQFEKIVDDEQKYNENKEKEISPHQKISKNNDNKLKNIQSLKRMSDIPKHIKIKQVEPMNFNSEGLNFQQTRVWIEQQQKYKGKEKPKIIRNRQSESYVELVSQPDLLNCNQNTDFSPHSSFVSHNINSQTNIQFCEQISPKRQSSQFLQRNNLNQNTYDKQRIQSTLNDISDNQIFSSSVNQAKNNSLACILPYRLAKMCSNSLNKNISPEKPEQNKETQVNNIHMQRLKEQRNQKNNVQMNKLKSFSVKQNPQNQSSQMNSLNNYAFIPQIGMQSNITPINSVQNSFYKQNEQTFISNVSPVRSKQSSKHIPQDQISTQQYLKFPLSALNQSQSPNKNNILNLQLHDNAGISSSQTTSSTTSNQPQLTQQSDTQYKRNSLNKFIDIFSENKQNDLFRTRQVSPTKLTHSVQFHLNQTPSSLNNTFSSSLKLNFQRPPSKNVQRSDSTKQLNKTSNQFTSQNVSSVETNQNGSILFQNNIISYKMKDIRVFKQLEEGNHDQNDLHQSQVNMQKQSSFKNILSRINNHNKDDNQKLEKNDNAQKQNDFFSSTEDDKEGEMFIPQQLKKILSSQSSISKGSSTQQSKFINSKQSFHLNLQQNIKNQNTFSNNPCINMNNSLGTSMNLQNLTKKQQSLQFRQSFSPKKISSTLMSKDNTIASVLEQTSNITKMKTLNTDLSPNRRRVIKMSEKPNQQQLETNTSYNTLNDNNIKTFYSNETFLAELNSQKNIKDIKESPTSLFRQNMYDCRIKQNVENKEGRKTVSRQNSVENIESSPQKINKKLNNSIDEDIQNNINEELYQQEKQQQQESDIFIDLNNKQNVKNRISKHHSICNLDSLKVNFKNLVRQKTFEPQTNLTKIQRSQSTKRVTELQSDMNLEEINDYHQQHITDQQLFEEKKREILQNLKEQEEMQLDKNILIENDQQKKQLNSVQRKQLGKSYIDFLKYYKQSGQIKINNI